MNRNVINRFNSAWFLWGAISTVLAFVTPWIGWYGLGNAAVLLSACYVIHLTKDRKKRIEQNQDVIARLTKKQKQQMNTLDEQEGKNILMLAFRLIPALTIFCGAINVYTFVFSMKTGHPAALFKSLETMKLLGEWTLLCLVLFFMVMFWIAFSGKVHQMMDTQRP